MDRKRTVDIFFRNMLAELEEIDQKSEFYGDENHTENAVIANIDQSVEIIVKNCYPKAQCQILFEEPRKLLCLKTFSKPLSQEYGKSWIHCQLKCYRKFLFLNVSTFEFSSLLIGEILYQTLIFLLSSSTFFCAFLKCKGCFLLNAIFRFPIQWFLLFLEI